MHITTRYPLIYYHLLMMLLSLVNHRLPRGDHFEQLSSRQCLTTYAHNWLTRTCPVIAFSPLQSSHFGLHCLIGTSMKFILGLRLLIRSGSRIWKAQRSRKGDGKGRQCRGFLPRRQHPDICPCPSMIRRVFSNRK